MGKFDFIFYNGESYILSSEELNTVLKTSYLTNRIINTILDDKTLDKLSVGDILDKYDYFTEKQVKKIEKYIYSHLKEKNSLFISDLIDCANRNNIESDIIFNFCINTIKKRRSSAIVLSSIVYLFEHMKIVQSVQLVPLFERVLNNKTYYQDCQVVSAFCLFRITMNPKYLNYIKELIQIDETLRDVIRNKMLLMDYNKNKRLFYYTIEDFISGCR